MQTMPYACMQYMRLPTTFNADAGLFIINNNRWMIPRESLFVIHYTLGNFKPWVWYTSWLITETHVWQVWVGGWVGGGARLC